MYTKKSFIPVITICILMIAMTIYGCKKDELTSPAQTSYDLLQKDVLGISGTVTFTQSSNSVTVELILNGADAGIHPAHIHLNSALESGAIAITLTPVDSEGRSTTSVSKLDNNTAINYDQLIAFDGYVNVHESAANLGVLLAQGDIGGNVLTGMSKSYDLTESDSLGVSGTALFEQRKNGNTLVTLDLTGTIAAAVHPAHIHLGSVSTVGGGPVVAPLNNVDGTTGKSYTNIRMLADMTPITYENWLEYGGYINVHESPANLASIICQGNIGTQ